MKSPVILLFAFASVRGTYAEVSPKELVRQSLANFQADHMAEAQFTYTERDEENTDGKTKVSISHVFAVNGLPFEMTVSRNGAELTGEQKAKEQAKLERRRRESPQERAKRLKDFGNSMKFLEEVPEAFQFKMLGTEMLRGREAYAIVLTPRPGYQPRNSRSAMFAHLTAKLWIDKTDVRWAKAEARVLETVAIGWVLARIEPGATIHMDQTKVDDRHWLPSLIDVNGTARVLLVKDRPIREHITFYDFRPASSVQKPGR